MKPSHWGVTPGMNPHFAKRIILTNLLGMTFAINMTLSLLAFIFLKLWILTVVTAFFVLTEMAWPLLNRSGAYVAARLGLLVSSNVLGFTVSVLLPGTGYNRGFYVMVALPFLLFSFSEKKSLILGCCLPLALYPLSEVVQHLAPVSLLGLDITWEVAQIISLTIGVVYLVLILLAFYFFARESERSLVALEEQRSRSFSSSKFAALGEMASGIAHEINNPLMGLNVANENLRFLLKEKDFSEETALEHVSIIARTVKRVGSIIHGMRNFSRDASQDPPETVSLQRIFGETLVFCQERFRNHGADLRIDFPDSEVFINCRPVQISQVILNLLNNAFDGIEHLPEKWVEIKLLDSSAGGVTLLITDSGSGIPSENQKKIFEPFFTTKPAGKGTGLGLSISRQIVYDHGGELILDSDHHRTRFMLRLPG